MGLQLLRNRFSKAFSIIETRPAERLEQRKLPMHMLTVYNRVASAYVWLSTVGERAPCEIFYNTHHLIEPRQRTSISNWLGTIYIQGCAPPPVMFSRSIIKTFCPRSRGLASLPVRRPRRFWDLHVPDVSTPVKSAADIDTLRPLGTTGAVSCRTIRRKLTAHASAPGIGYPYQTLISPSLGRATGYIGPTGQGRTH
jgi:hypothetical protein